MSICQHRWGRKEPFCKGLLIIIKSNAYSDHNRHLNRSCPKEYATDFALYRFVGDGSCLDEAAGWPLIFDQKAPSYQLGAAPGKRKITWLPA